MEYPEKGHFPSCPPSVLGVAHEQLGRPVPPGRHVVRQAAVGDVGLGRPVVAGIDLLLQGCERSGQPEICKVGIGAFRKEYRASQ